MSTTVEQRRAPFPINAANGVDASPAIGLLGCHEGELDRGSIVEGLILRNGFR
jgi:hypothetical protein